MVKEGPIPGKTTRSRHDVIVHGLGMDIVAGKFSPEQRLPPEATLLKRFAVSRTLLREALKTLSAKGLISTRTKVGTRVRREEDWHGLDADVLAWGAAQTPNTMFFDHLRELRRAIGPVIAEAAALYRCPPDVHCLRKSLLSMEGRVDAASFHSAVRDLNLALANASYNPLLAAMARAVEGAILQERIVTPAEGASPTASCVALYRRLVEAVEERNATVAVQAMNSLLNRSNPHEQVTAS